MIVTYIQYDDSPLNPSTRLIGYNTSTRAKESNMWSKLYLQVLLEIQEAGKLTSADLALMIELFSKVSEKKKEVRFNQFKYRNGTTNRVFILIQTLIKLDVLRVKRVTNKHGRWFIINPKVFIGPRSIGKSNEVMWIDMKPLSNTYLKHMREAKAKGYSWCDYPLPDYVESRRKKYKSSGYVNEYGLVEE